MGAIVSFIGGIFFWFFVVFFGIIILDGFGCDREERLAHLKQCMAKYEINNREDEMKYRVRCSDEWTRMTDPAYTKK